jgi:hypothetical protein
MNMDDTNQNPKPELFNPITKAAERILSNLFGSEIHFTDVQRLSEPERRNLILRCITVPTRNFPSSFIVKKVEAKPYHPEDSNSWATQRFFSDWIGSQFLSSLGGGANHGPHCYGGNRDLGFIILEDMGQPHSLVEPLLQEDAASAEAALLRYSTRLGKLHADTVNQQHIYEQLFQSIGSNGRSLASTEQKLKDSIEKVKTVLDRLEVSSKPGFIREVQEIVRAVVNPEPFLAYIHGDPCPDNVFDNHQQMRLIDFEFGHFGHALIDGTYARMIFPTCWCANRLPQSVVVQMERRYRTEFIKGCSEAEEDGVWEQALVTICGYWLLKTLEWHLEPALNEDQSWGLASLRQRVLARLQAFVTASEELGLFPAIHGTASHLVDALGERWPETQSLPLYPAFQNA